MGNMSASFKFPRLSVVEFRSLTGWVDR